MTTVLSKNIQIHFYMYASANIFIVDLIILIIQS